MLSKLIEGVSGKMSERWTISSLAPALVFWLGGLLALAQKHGWRRPATLPSADSIETLTLTLVALLLILSSSALIQRLEVPFLRLLEGYWPAWWPFSWLKRLGVARQFRHRAAMLKTLETLRRQEEGLRIPFEASRRRAYFYRQTVQPSSAGEAGTAEITSDEASEAEREYFSLLCRIHEIGTQRAALERIYGLMPGDEYLMPTLLGNILRVAERQPQIRYGLNAVVCYSRLWYVLSQEARQELASARTTVNDAGQLCLWGLLFLGWPLYLWHLKALIWTIPAGALVAWFAYNWLCDRAAVFGDLLVGAFDTQRIKLYQTLRWPLPETPAEERIRGEEITVYLLGMRPGSIDTIRLTSPAPTAPADGAKG